MNSTCGERGRKRRQSLSRCRGQVPRRFSAAGGGFDAGGRWMAVFGGPQVGCVHVDGPEKWAQPPVEVPDGGLLNSVYSVDLDGCIRWQRRGLHGVRERFVHGADWRVGGRHMACSGQQRPQDADQTGQGRRRPTRHGDASRGLAGPRG